jgi:hypothetical protein
VRWKVEVAAHTPAQSSRYAVINAQDATTGGCHWCSVLMVIGLPEVLRFAVYVRRWHTVIAKSGTIGRCIRVCLKVAIHCDCDRILAARYPNMRVSFGAIQLPTPITHSCTGTDEYSRKKSFFDIANFATSKSFAS